VQNSLTKSDISPTMEAVEMDPSTGANIFNTEYKKHGDLKEMLDSSKDSQKLDAMKRIIAMLAKGRDVSDLFPAVVKNVASKNIEIKKLVYVYLSRYAEEKQDLALLSISTFQRALKDPNQLIRASALRVLSSIRVPVIVPIMLPAIKESAADMSPFVRKTAAHAIPKLYSLDPEMKEELVAIIERLLADRTTLVIGSAAMAFEEVCPDRNDLIHKNYRKLVNLIVDVEEWGQVTLLNILTRYARTQFLNPNQGMDFPDLKEKEFYENTDDEDEDEEEEKIIIEEDKIKPYKMDPDHRLLLRSTKPLLQSRNASVVMATSQLYWHLAPKSEIQVVAKALVRLLRSHYEIQSIVLNSIASMTVQEFGGARIFGPYLRQFFVRGCDPSHVKILKLEILTNLARPDNISILLREFQSYISGGEKSSVAATIQAIGRCAASIPEVTATCLTGLVQLLSSPDQAVVAESVLEIKKLLQTQQEEHKDIISQMAKLIDTIDVPSARAAVLWVVGEYCRRIPLIAPDVLRKLAKSFCAETEEVKVQVLNLSVKLCLTNPKQTKLLTQYVLNLAKYDMNYDIRDRARYIRAFLFPAGEPGRLQAEAKSIFLAEKPAPTYESRFENRHEYQLGSLSHYINARAMGYQDLPEYPEEAPDPSVRNVEPPKPANNPWKQDNTKKVNHKKTKSGKFYDSDESAGRKNGKGGSEESSGTSDSGSSSSSSSSESEDDVIKPRPKKQQPVAPKPAPVKKAAATKKIVKQAVESSEESTDDDSSSEEEDLKPRVSTSKPKAKPSKAAAVAAPAPKSNLDLLLDLDSPGLGAPVSLTPIMQTTSAGGGFERGMEEAATAPMYVATNSTELLNKLTTGGVQVNYRFTRHPHIYAADMLSLELSFHNQGAEDSGEIKVGTKRLAAGGMSIHEFPGLLNVSPGQSLSATLGIDFRDTTQPASFDLVIGGRPHAVNLQVPTGEMVRPVRLSATEWTAEVGKLRGMCETRGKMEIPSQAADIPTLTNLVYRAANVLQVPSSDANVLQFAGRTLSLKKLVLIKINKEVGECVVNTENIVIGNMILKEIKAVIEKS